MLIDFIPRTSQWQGQLGLLDKRSNFSKYCSRHCLWAEMIWRNWDAISIVVLASDWMSMSGYKSLGYWYWWPFLDTDQARDRSSNSWAFSCWILSEMCWKYCVLVYICIQIRLGFRVSNIIIIIVNSDNHFSHHLVIKCVSSNSQCCHIWSAYKLEKYGFYGWSSSEIC